MPEAVSAFGYSVSFTVVLLSVALVVGLALAVMFWLTVGLSVYRSVGRTRRQKVRDEIQEQLLEGIFDSEVDWGAWVDGLSKVERDVAESLLDEYLRELDGRNLERLQELGDELGIVERAERRLQGRDEFKRLYALTWLTLLDRPEPLYRANVRPRTPRERAAIARLRYESGDLDDFTEIIALLLEDTTTQFTIFGQDTLYRIATEEPSSLFNVAERNYRTWSEPLLVQVLSVCQHLGTSITTEDLSWLTATLEHESEAVREAATRAFENVGWRSDVRNERFLRRLVDDPSPRVRGAAYEVLARWGDDQAVSTLVRGLKTETDARARLTGTDALVRREEFSKADLPSALAAAWEWSSEHAEYDRIARQRSNGVPN